MNHIIIGETCLLNKQLRRCGIINTQHGCFDDTLVNLNALNHIVDDDFKYVIDKNHMKYINYCFYPAHNLCYDKWINAKYSEYGDATYSWDVLSFFHLHNEKDWDTLARRFIRTQSWFEDGTDTTLYYYRRHDQYNIEKHHSNLIKFQEKITAKYFKKFKIFNINNKLGDDCVECEMLTPSICSVEITSNNSWIDIDDNWDAHLDNTLFDDMIANNQIKQFLNL